MGHSFDRRQGPAGAKHCKISGDGLTQASVGQLASFQIIACNDKGIRYDDGGDPFYVQIRAAGHGTRVRARVVDHNNGSYTMSYKPTSSGKLLISVSIGGEPIPGSPYSVVVVDTTPTAPQCLLSGGALTSVVAHRNESFFVSFRDALGQVAHACELDVWVQPLFDPLDSPPSSTPVATPPPPEPEPPPPPPPPPPPSRLETLQEELRVLAEQHVALEQFIREAGKAPAASERSFKERNLRAKLLDRKAELEKAIQAEIQAERAQAAQAEIQPLQRQSTTVVASPTGSPTPPSVIPAAIAPLLEPLGEFEALVVGSTSLDVFSTRSDLKGEWMGQLTPGTALKLIRLEPIDADGLLRACVAVDFRTLDASSIESRVTNHESGGREVFAQQLSWRERERASWRREAAWFQHIEADLIGRDKAVAAHIMERELKRHAAAAKILQAVARGGVTRIRLRRRQKALIDAERAAAIAAGIVIASDGPPKERRRPLTASPSKASLSRRPPSPSTDKLKEISPISAGGPESAAASPPTSPSPTTASAPAAGAAGEKEKGSPGKVDRKGKEGAGSTKAEAVKDAAKEGAKDGVKAKPGAVAAPKPATSAPKSSKKAAELAAASSLKKGAKPTAASAAKRAAEELSAATFIQAFARGLFARHVVNGRRAVAMAAEMERLVAEDKGKRGKKGKKGKTLEVSKAAAAAAAGAERPKATGTGGVGSDSGSNRASSRKSLKGKGGAAAKDQKDQKDQKEGGSGAKDLAGTVAAVEAQDKRQAYQAASALSKGGETGVSTAPPRPSATVVPYGARSPGSMSARTGPMALEVERLSKLQSQSYGWVILAVGGRALVSRHVLRLPASVRQLHLQHWTRRAAIDSERERERAKVRDVEAEEAKAREAQRLLAGIASPRATSSPRQKFSAFGSSFGAFGSAFSGFGAEAPAYLQSAAPGGVRTSVPPIHTSYLNDIVSDPRRIGFAYGGVYPGRLHAKGHLVERHEVHFSVGVCGNYLLHVRLRQPSGKSTGDDALPGSPFKLHVAPGPAHPLLTPLPPVLHGTSSTAEASKRDGERASWFGSSPSPVASGDKIFYLCEHLMRVCDKMGNRCVLGGANLACGFLQRVPGLSEELARELAGEAAAGTGAPVEARAEGGSGAAGRTAGTLAALDASEATDAGASGQQHASWADLGDGTYLLRWASDAPGVFDVFVKIDGLHVLGSPSRLLLAPPPPPPPTRRRLSSTGTSVVDSPSGTKGPAETASRVMGGTDS